MKRFIAALLCAASVFLLCACGGLYDKEYYSESDYVQSTQSEDNSSFVVKNISELQKAITDIILSGLDADTIAFDSLYSGDIYEDLSSACWLVRTQDAFCAFCVETLSFEVIKVMTTYEAKISVTYSQSEERINSVVRMNYSYDAESAILTALDHGREKLTLYINNASYSEQDMELLIKQVYMKKPLCVPYQPSVDIALYSGAGGQKLYDISFDYHMSEEEFTECKKNIEALDLLRSLDSRRYDSSQRAYYACQYLLSSCALTDGIMKNSAYSALVLGEADSEGLALAYEALCSQIGVACKVVEGQRDWSTHYWNIITLFGENYHVDVSQCIELGIEVGFLKSDKDMWENYRWDMASYPSCSGTLSAAEFIISDQQ